MINNRIWNASNSLETILILLLCIGGTNIRGIHYRTYRKIDVVSLEIDGGLSLCKLKQIQFWS